MEQAGVAGASLQAGGLLTTMEAAVALRLGYAATLAAIKRGDLPARKVGKAYRVPQASIDALVTPTLAASATPVHTGAR